MGFLSGLIPRKFYRRYYEKEVALYEEKVNEALAKREENEDEEES